MQRAFSYAAAVAATSLLTACPQDPPSFVNLGTESATEGLTEGDDTTGEPPDMTTSGGSTSTGSDESSSDGGSSSSSTGDPPGGICGDGMISGQEECDCGGGPCTPEGLDNKTCVDAEPDPLIHLGPLTGGVLGCNPASCKFEVELCTWCGDGEINGGENCEPDLPIVETCMTLGEGSAGDLTCGEACQLDTAGCTECGAQFDFNDCLDPAWFLQLTHGNRRQPAVLGVRNPRHRPHRGPAGQRRDRVGDQPRGQLPRERERGDHLAGHQPRELCRRRRGRAAGDPLVRVRGRHPQLGRRHRAGLGRRLRVGPPSPRSPARCTSTRTC